MMDDNRSFLAANHIKSLENALFAVKYGARNALHSLILIWFYIALHRTPNLDCYRVGAVPKVCRPSDSAARL